MILPPPDDAPVADWREYWRERFVHEPGRGCAPMGTSAQYSELNARIKQVALSRILSAIDGPVASALDIGCGYGNVLDLLTARGVRHIAATDVSEDGLAQLRPRYPGVEFSTGFLGVNPLPVHSGGFDLVFAFDMMHCIRDDGEFASALQAVVGAASRHGYLVVSDRFERSVRWDDLKASSHIRNRSMDAYRAPLTAAGFKLVTHVAHSIFFNNEWARLARVSHLRGLRGTANLLGHYALRHAPETVARIELWMQRQHHPVARWFVSASDRQVALFRR